VASASTMAAMATRFCWRCGVKTHMAPYGSAYVVPRTQLRLKVVWCAFRCDSCSALSVAVATPTANDGVVDSNATKWVEALEDALDWYPVSAIGKDFPDVPEHIAEAASEAYKCRSISAFRAAAQLARSVVEATAKDKGIAQGQLITKIEELYNQGFIRAYVKDGAHEIRHLGNEMAHGDFVTPVTGEDADLVLTLMSEILDEVYQSPARVAQAQAARAARNATPTP
jgi:hypothetical protein